MARPDEQSPRPSYTRALIGCSAVVRGNLAGRYDVSFHAVLRVEGGGAVTTHLPTVPISVADMPVAAGSGNGQVWQGTMAASEQDFAEFVRAALPGLLRYGHALTGNPHDAADLVQTVLEKVGSRWSRVTDCADPTAYVRRAMVNAHISKWRRTRRETLLAEFPDIPTQADGDRLENEPVWQALRALPARQRAVVVLRYYEGLSEDEIATSLGIASGTVKSQASKALVSLRQRLGGGDD